MSMLMRVFMSIIAHESSHEHMLVRALTGMHGYIHEGGLTSKRYIEPGLINGFDLISALLPHTVFPERLHWTI